MYSFDNQTRLLCNPRIGSFEGAITRCRNNLIDVELITNDTYKLTDITQIKTESETESFWDSYSDLFKI